MHLDLDVIVMAVVEEKIDRAGVGKGILAVI
jgi:hypothetical protein